MESTKIPKAFSKVPMKIPKLKVPPPKDQRSGAFTDDMIKPAASHNRAILRRRSKSVSDLKISNTKPLKALNKAVKTSCEKPVSARIGQKRPALQHLDGENKPKVAKVKIPDWDYKSRFNELQKKHTTLQDEYKSMKSKAASLLELEENYEHLLNENAFKTSNIENLERTVSTLREENERILEEDSRNKLKLSKIERDYEELKESHGKLQKKYEESERRLRESDQLTSSLQQKCDSLETLSQRLKDDLSYHEDLRRNMHNTIQDLKGNIRVFCRVRPPVTTEEKNKQLCSILFPNESCLEIKKSKESVTSFTGKGSDLRQEFSFDKVFPPESVQEEVFEELSHLVQSAVDGYDVCVFAYGQTGSGKTYTMQGSPDDRGMIPRTIDLIFDKLEKLSLSDWTYTVSVSFLEIYNETIRDLLDPKSTHNYELRYNNGKGVTVTNLQIKTISSAKELKKLMDEAHRNRAVAITDFNEHSSRSHAVTKINLEGYNKTSKVRYLGSVNLVDLAGSESAKTSSSERMTETKNINKSLATLGNVILALHNKDSHIPFRNSKLTFLLQSCLGGNSKTLMFVNIAPFEESYSESINSLRFAVKVKDVKTYAKKNKTN